MVALRRGILTQPSGLHQVNVTSRGDILTTIPRRGLELTSEGLPIVNDVFVRDVQSLRGVLASTQVLLHILLRVGGHGTLLNEVRRL